MTILHLLNKHPLFINVSNIYNNNTNGSCSSQSFSNSFEKNVTSQQNPVKKRLLFLAKTSMSTSSTKNLKVIYIKIFI